MATRRFCREWAVQFLFQNDFNVQELPGALHDFWANQKADQAARAFTEKLITGVMQHCNDLDERIKKYTEHWEIKRMNAVDRNVIRLALYEMFFMPDIPPVVSINEAVDIAKRFSSNESGRFVNGILDCARKDLSRPSRTPALSR